jgi:hypothetical protein
VIRATFGSGSKSEREAVMLDTGREQLVLRRRGGNAFRDQVLETLVGRRIRGTGSRSGYTFVLDQWEDDDEARA